jgi:hypothetical protein
VAAGCREASGNITAILCTPVLGPIRAVLETPDRMDTGLSDRTRPRPAGPKRRGLAQNIKSFHQRLKRDTKEMADVVELIPRKAVAKVERAEKRPGAKAKSRRGTRRFVSGREVPVRPAQPVAAAAAAEALAEPEERPAAGVPVGSAQAGLPQPRGAECQPLLIKMPWVSNDWTA